MAEDGGGDDDSGGRGYHVDIYSGGTYAGSNGFATMEAAKGFANMMEAFGFTINIGPT